MIDSISFGVTAVDRSRDQLQRCLARIAAQNVPDFEIIVGGVDERPRPGLHYLFRAEWQTAVAAPVNEIRNEFCKRATKRFVALLDASVELEDGWYAAVKAASRIDVIEGPLVLVLRREVWETVEFDESPGAATDDVDFCRRAAREGYRVGLVPDATARLTAAMKSCHDRVL